jgi:hypothetical protein
VRNYHRPHSSLYKPRARATGLSFLDSWPLKMRPTGCPETSARNYRQSLRNNQEDPSSQLLRSGNQKYRKFSHLRNIPLSIPISGRETNMGKTNGNWKLSKTITIIPTTRTFSNNLNSSAC